MPAVSDLLSTIKDLANVGTGDSTDDARIMRYVNLVYGEAWRKAAKIYPTVLRTTETVSVTSGVSTFAQPHAILSVRDANNNYAKLEPATLENIEADDPEVDDSGSPTHYYFDGGVLKTWPVNSTSLRVRHIPSITALASGGAESTIKIRPEFHDILVWGPLVYLGYDERDKSVGPEIQTAQSKFEIGMADWTSWLTYQQTQEPVQTEVGLGG